MAHPLTLNAISPLRRGEWKEALAYLEEEFIGTYPWFPQWLTDVQAGIAAGTRILYVITAGGTAVGVFLINRSDPTAIKANAMVIWPQFRGRGYSREAYKALFDGLDSEVDFVFTQCKEGNLVARRLITSVGFRQIGRLRHLLEQSADNLLFARMLSKTSNATLCIEKASELYDVPGVKEFVPVKRGAHGSP